MFVSVPNWLDDKPALANICAIAANPCGLIGCAGFGVCPCADPTVVVFGAVLAAVVGGVVCPADVDGAAWPADAGGVVWACPADCPTVPTTPTSFMLLTYFSKKCFLRPATAELVPCVLIVLNFE